VRAIFANAFGVTIVRIFIDPGLLQPWAAISERLCVKERGWQASKMQTKLMGMEQAISRFVHDGDVVVIEGFTHLICFAAAHEIIRQRRRELTFAVSHLI